MVINLHNIPNIYCNFSRFMIFSYHQFLFFKDMLKKFAYTLQDKKIFNQELSSFLPQRIIDIHVHLWKRNHIKSEKLVGEQINQQPFLDQEIVDGFTYEDFNKIIKVLFPGKNYEGVFFGFPYRVGEIDKINLMMKEEILKKEKDSFFIPRPKDDYDFLVKTIKKDGFLGLKPYPDLANDVDYTDQDTVCISDFLTESHLKAANRFNMIIMLHIPKKRRLNDEKNIEEIRNICSTFPNIKLVLAHAGRSYCPSDIKESIKKIKDLKNLYVDTSMVNERRVLELLFENLNIEKIIFGSDLPVAGIKGKNICINNKHYFVTSEKYPWSITGVNIKEEDLTFFIYEEIREILDVVLRLKGHKDIINKIFYKNALNLLNDTKVKLGREQSGRI